LNFIVELLLESDRELLQTRTPRRTKQRDVRSSVATHWSGAGADVRRFAASVHELICRARFVKRIARASQVYRCSSDFLRRFAQEFHEIDSSIFVFLRGLRMA